MRNIHCSLLVLLPHLLIFLCLAVVPAAALRLQCLKDEKTVLLELKSELVFDSNYSTKLVKWNESADEWDGVVCNDMGRVVSLYLAGESISGGLNIESSSLFRLQHLEMLNLNSNALSGSIPYTLFALPSLQVLVLSNNKFSGGIDDNEFPFPSANSKLVEVYLSFNSLSGRIPFSFFDMPLLQKLYLSSNKFSEFPNIVDNDHHLIKLVDVDLSSNSLSGSISIPLSFFGNMPSLKLLDLSSNQFSGQIIFNDHHIFFSNLESLSLSNNLLNGSIPYSFFGLPSLEILRLSNNQFSGKFLISANISTSNLGFLYLDNNRLEGPILDHNQLIRLPNLMKLDVSYNNFNYLSDVNSTSLHAIFPSLKQLSLASCNLTSFPDFLKQTTLESLDLSNNQIAGDIPRWVWETGLIGLNVSFNSLDNLQKPYLQLLAASDIRSLDLHSNQLRGELPPLPQKAFYVDYSSNYFDNYPIPSTFFRNINVNFLSLANNSLSGAIPTSICNISITSVLDLSFNNLTGTIPPCFVQDSWSLQVLNLRGNNIHGVIPDRFPIPCNLRTLDLSFNNLQGKIPESLANCKFLKVLNVGYNNLDHTFPCMLPSSLRVLVLRSNRFHGELGSSSCKSYWSWSSNLQIVDVSYNHFNGTLHGLNLSNWRGMMMLENGTRVRTKHSASDLLSPSYYYKDEVTLTVKGLEVNLVKIWPEFTSIDLSCNNFQGGIPNAVGDLTSLYLLNLSHNALTGTVPKSLGALTELGSLDLSTNQLSGRIPEELAGLTFLSILNVSYNELVGMIPTGSQFRTFSADCFKGNMGLCGFPLNRSCSDGSGSSPPKEEDDDEEEIEWEYVSGAVGYGVGLGSIAWIMLFWRGFRERCFHKIEEVAHKILDNRDMRRRRRRRRRRLAR